MSQTNKQLVLQALHALDRGDADAVAELHHPDYVNHEAAAGRQRGPEGARATAVFLQSVFADLRHEPLDAVAERDLVVIRAQASGRHVGEIDGFAATGRTFSVQHVHIFRITDGKIREHWACRDDLGAARQMGLVPKPGGDGAQPRRKAWRRQPRPATTGPDGSHDAAPAADLARLVNAAGPWMAWVGIPLVRTQRHRGNDRR